MMNERAPSKTTPQDRRRRVLEHFHSLGVAVSDERLDVALGKADKGGWSHLQLLDDLLGEQAARRRQRAIERRIQEAKFPEVKTLEAFDWQFNAEAIDRAQIEQLAGGEFIRRRDNLLMVGTSGVGKSHLLMAIGRRACTLGYRVRYAASDELLNDLVASLADDGAPNRIRHFCRFDLLIIDGFGFDKLEREKTSHALSLLYKLIERRNGKRSTALITNIDLQSWTEYLGDPPMVMALLDRLVDSAIMVNIDGESYRAHRGRQATAKARSKKPKTAKSK